ncbi:hypothetical protein QYF36_024780 [Acer negundo]|nr:hypothetical protein QYF36_024780 [Acer negundo]
MRLCIQTDPNLSPSIHGNLADPRTRATFKRHGIEITSLSRQIRTSDFKDSDLILAMDKQNREDIVLLVGGNSGRHSLKMHINRLN